MVTDESSLIKQFFTAHHIPLSSEWLESCINWCKEENLPPGYTIKDLQTKIYEQWLLLDLRDVEVPCLPPNLAEKQKYVLNGTYSLQMLEIIDISKPKYLQLQQIRNTTLKNADQEVVSAKRALLLTLTDGGQEIKCLEFKPIPSLNLKLTPGIKIKLMGPVTVRRGRLMLGSENVKVLGGEVEDLIIANAAENILARALNLPLNPNPQAIEEQVVAVDLNMLEEGENTAPLHRQGNVGNSRGNLPEAHRQYNQQIQNYGENDLNIVDDEEAKIAAEIAALMEVENEFEEELTANRRPKSKTPDMFNDINDYDFENIAIPAMHDKSIKTKSTDLHRNKVESKQSANTLSESLDNDLFENIDVTLLEKIEKQKEHKPAEQTQRGIIAVNKLLKNMSNITNGKFQIRVKFKSIVEKLTIAEDEFYLVVKVEDETGDITVKFHSDVVAQLIEYSPSALMSLKNGVMENDTDAQAKVLQALRRLKEKLVDLNNVLEIEISAREAFPLAIKLL